jgi:LPXTG-motif cell wall-anchored protein
MRSRLAAALAAMVGLMAAGLVAVAAPAAATETLPVTGSTPLWFALAGLAALGSGALLYALARRRRVQFRA